MVEDNIRRLRRPATKSSVFRRRWKTNWMGQLWTPEGRAPCLVADISAIGAKLLVDHPFAKDIEVSLVIAGYPAVAARVAWCRRGWVGIHFEENQPAIFDLVDKAAKATPANPQGQAPKP